MTTTVSASRNVKANSLQGVTAIERIHIDLDEMVRRLRREIWFGGMLTIGTATVTAFLGLLVIDAVFQPESAWMRVALWIPMMAVVWRITRRFLMIPLQEKCDRIAMAWTLEQKQPAIEERLTTSLQLFKNPTDKRSSIIEAVAQQAHRSLAGCQEEDLRGQEVFVGTIVAGACLVTFVLSMWTWAPYLIPSLQNVLNPFSSRVLPHLNATIVPGNTHVAEDGDLEVTATAGRLSDAVLEIIENDAVIASHQMATKDNGGTAEFTLTQLKIDRQYRIRSGGLYSDRYQIYVDPKPVIKSSQAKLTFPEYTQLPPQVANDLAEPIEVLHGTQIQIDVDSTLPANESSLSLNGTSTPGGDAVLIEESGLWRHTWEFTAKEGGTPGGTITLVSEAGVLSEPLHFDVRTLPDMPPSIVIDQPALPEVIAKPDQIIPVSYHAVDDFGCGALRLSSQKNSEPPSTKEHPQDLRAEFSGELTIDLDEMELVAGDQLTFWLSVFDNRPDEYGGPQSADTRKIHVRIADDSIPVGQQVVQNEEQAVMADLTEALDQLQVAAKISDELQTNLSEPDDKAAQKSDAVEKSKQLQDRIKEAEQALCRMSDRDELAPQRLFQEEMERIEDVTENEVSEARKQAGLVPLSDELSQQLEAIAATKESLSDAIEKLEQIREDVEVRGKRLEMAARLDELATQQERLAQKEQAGCANASEVQKQQQQVADALQEVVEQELDAKSKQFAQRAGEAAKLMEEAAELQQQQETLAKLDQVRNKEELDDKLLEMIAREQEQIAAETRMLDEQRGDIQPPAADPQKQAPAEAKETGKGEANEAVKAERKKKPTALDEARKQMEAVPEKLRQRDLQQAEDKARKAGERLQEAAKSVPANAAQKPNANAEDNAQQKKDDLERLGKQQERVGDAIKAVRENRPEEAVAKLQEQIAKRTDRLREKADELLQLPSDDPENQQAVREAREKLELAKQETKAAQELAKQQREQIAGPEQAADQKQAADPKQAADTKQAPEPKRAADTKQAPEPKRAADPKQAAAPKQAADPKQAGDPKQAAEPEHKQAAEPRQVADPKQAVEQQKQAAKSLEEATQSLDKVCKSCKKCSNCNKPGGSSGSSGSSPKNGAASSKPGDSKPGDSKQGNSEQGDSKQGDSKPGDSKQGDSRPGDSKQGGNSGETGNSSPKQQQAYSEKLAATADKAHQTARNPSPNRTQELAQELKQLADDAAQRGGHPNRRNSNQRGGQSKPSNSTDSTQQAGAPQPGSPSKPQGVQGNQGADASEVAPVQLRGRSTSNWTQSRSKLKNNVLDDQDSKIPEEFRSAVKDYFEELSRLESRKDTTENQE